MVYVCYYHATEDRIEHAVSYMALPQFVRQNPFARILSWVPLKDESEGFALRDAGVPPLFLG